MPQMEEDGQQNQKLSLLSETVSNLIALLESVSSGVTNSEARLRTVEQQQTKQRIDVAALEAQACPFEARLKVVEQRQQSLGNDMGTLEATFCQLRRDVSDILPVLGKQVQDLTDFRGLESRREGDTRQYVSTCVKALASEAAETQKSVAKQVNKLEEEIQACRQQLADAHGVLARTPEILAMESSIRSRVDDTIATTKAQVESLVSGTSLKAHQHLSKESQRIESELNELANSLRRKCQLAREQLAEEYRVDFDNTVNGMKGALDLELSTSCKELKLVMNMWHNYIADVADSWAQHARHDSIYTPQVVRDVTNCLDETSMALTKQLSHLRSHRPQLVHPKRCMAPRPWRPP